MDGALGMVNAGLGCHPMLAFHVAGEPGVASLLWLVVERQADGYWWGTCAAGAQPLELQRNAIAFLDTGHWTPDAARRCNAPDFGYNPIRLSVLSLDLFASQLSISCIVLAVIDIGELFFFFTCFGAVIRVLPRR